VLLGPTGAGKTPVGDLLESRGSGGRRYHHFDFGAQMRQAAATPEAFPSLGDAGVAVVRRVLADGALLEDGEFGVALGLLRDFAAARGAGPRDRLVLNGLPRHAGQAVALEPEVDVDLVVSLECGPRTSLARIRRSRGGERAGREDDGPALVEKKLRWFRERTVPLVEHYRRRGVRVVELPVTAATRPEDVVRRIRRAAAAGGKERSGAWRSA
jgi:adenylate kinase family enzyme